MRFEGKAATFTAPCPEAAEEAKLSALYTNI